MFRLMNEPMLHGTDSTLAAGRRDAATSDAPDLEALADFYKVFGDPTRLRILRALMDAELCVHDLAAELEMGQSAVSHQLRILKQAHLVRSRRVGKESHYALSDEHVRVVFEQGLVHVNEGSRA
jgi:ArsR family transcriptional regulator, lead/cadmium/zinc/bismuth-responsive transcriptional repressor